MKNATASVSAKEEEFTVFCLSVTITSKWRATETVYPFLPALIFRMGMHAVVVLFVWEQAAQSALEGANAIAPLPPGTL